MEGLHWDGCAGCRAREGDMLCCCDCSLSVCTTCASSLPNAYGTSLLSHMVHAATAEYEPVPVPKLENMPYHKAFSLGIEPVVRKLLDLGGESEGTAARWSLGGRVCAVQKRDASWRGRGKDNWAGG